MEKQSGSGRRAREMRKYRRTELLILLLILAILAVFFIVLYLGKLHKVWDPNETHEAETTTIEDYEKWEKQHIQDLIDDAERIAAGYDFDGAVSYLKSDDLYSKTLVLLEKAEEIQKRKENMKAWPDVKDITHVTVKPLIADVGKALEAGVNASNYTQQHITVTEFKKLLQELYDRGYVLVSLHDIAYSKKYVNSMKEEATDSSTEESVTETAESTTEETTTEETTTEETTTEETTEESIDDTDESDDETTTESKAPETTVDDLNLLRKGKIMLPEGKIPFVLSEENICYSAELAAHGFASKLVINKDGKVVCEMADGSRGAFDLVPILEEFIYEHPDFSYKGARAVLGIAGSEGIFGYRTSYLYCNNDDYEDQKSQATRIGAALKELGYEFGMNGYHYSNMGHAAMDQETFERECVNWQKEVATLIGSTDIIMFPNGDDIGDWHYYSGERYDYLNKMGYTYYLNMNSSERAWNQLLNYYLRQGRRLITGNNIFKELAGASAFTDLFDAVNVYDPARTSHE